METTLDREFFKKSFVNISQLIEKNRDHLSNLDSEIGDGDHGINLSIGFREVTNQLDDLDDSAKDLSEYFKKIGMILLGKVGGASGPLYGSFFMKMGSEMTGKNEASLKDFAVMFENGVKAVEQRGKTGTGEKTMVDALRPGADYLNSQDLTDNELEHFEKFIEVMKQGAEDTVEMFPKKGRSAKLGERAVGHKDPGAESSWLMMNAFNEEFQNRIKED